MAFMYSCIICHPFAFAVTGKRGFKKKKNQLQKKKKKTSQNATKKWQTWNSRSGGHIVFEGNRDDHGVLRRNFKLSNLIKSREKKDKSEFLRLGLLTTTLDQLHPLGYKTTCTFASMFSQQN